jgi:hypothetical protein
MTNSFLYTIRMYRNLKSYFSGEQMHDNQSSMTLRNSLFNDDINNVLHLDF